jgi:hypothetical protein
MADVLFPVFGTLVPPMLGRRKVMDRLWRELTKNTPTHLQVVGPRYAGKTVLLQALATRMQDDDSPYRIDASSRGIWVIGLRSPMRISSWDCARGLQRD